MNKEQITGKFDQAAGRIKQKAGEAVGNQKLANSGVADQIKGAAKETWGRVKDTADDVRKTAETRIEAEKDDRKRQAEDQADNTRERIATATQHVKENIGNKLDDIQARQRQEREDI